MSQVSATRKVVLPHYAPECCSSYPEPSLLVFLPRAKEPFWRKAVAKVYNSRYQAPNSVSSGRAPCLRKSVYNNGQWINEDNDNNNGLTTTNDEGPTTTKDQQHYNNDDNGDNDNSNNSDDDNYKNNNYDDNNNDYATKNNNNDNNNW
ncbi:hypothetical protein Glove_12g70 [Diversispora epigaea]|uniref:Uncharacterized protein n=1 Tax=Diversispora epigaea TaxID=1348612 RepID=A0A397JS48_9GLOM|nr:hypothetical protein Glove_12g70 [Diversispora epigaea]